MHLSGQWFHRGDKFRHRIFFENLFAGDVVELTVHQFRFVQRPLIAQHPQQRGTRYRLVELQQNFHPAAFEDTHFAQHAVKAFHRLSGVDRRRGSHHGQLDFRCVNNVDGEQFCPGAAAHNTVLQRIRDSCDLGDVGTADFVKVHRQRFGVTIVGGKLQFDLFRSITRGVRSPSWNSRNPDVGSTSDRSIAISHVKVQIAGCRQIGERCDQSLHQQLRTRWPQQHRQYCRENQRSGSAEAFPGLPVVYDFAEFNLSQTSRHLIPQAFTHDCGAGFANGGFRPLD